MRIALVYDCLYPQTVGGAERWLRELALTLAEDHEVTYLTRRQWERGEDPGLEGVECVAVSPPGELHLSDGKRRVVPTILFGAGVFLHLVRNRRRYDVVHCLSYPYVSLLGARLALAGRASRTRLYCEWLECLTDGYWRGYGRWSGNLGKALQRTCVRMTPRAIAFSDHTRRRLRECGFSGSVEVVGGLAMGCRGGGSGATANGAAPLVLFAGRHVPDKGIRALLEALVIARRSQPDLQAVIVGDGPERAAVLEDIARLHLATAVSAPGFVSREELDDLLARATCLAYPSIRDGYGMVVAESMAAGVPAVVCRAPDNASTELIEEGVNGAIAEDASPGRLAAAILKVVEDAGSLRSSTATWYGENAERLSMRRSIERVLALYDAPSGPAARSNRSGAKQGDEAQEVGGGDTSAAGAPSGPDGRRPGALGHLEAPVDDSSPVELGVGQGIGE